MVTGMGGVLAGRAVWGLSDAELADAFTRNVVADRQLAAERLALIGELEARGVPSLQGFTSVASWLRQVLKVSVLAASRVAKLAKQLPGLPDAAKALGDGGISADQAAVIAHAVEAMPPVHRVEAQRLMASEAVGLDLRELEVFGVQIHHYLDPEGADEAALKALEQAERKAWEQRRFTLTPDGMGGVRISGRTDAEGAAIIQSALDPLCNPARAASRAGTAEGAAGVDAILPDDGGLPMVLQDNRNAAQRRHDAAIEIFQLALHTGDLPGNGGDKAQVVVTIQFDPVEGAVKAGMLDTGARLSPEAVRRLACDAGIIPAVLDSAGVPLDLGRERRLISGALRRALVLRDKGCAWPGCERPPKWCAGHHVIHWSRGGTTCLANSVLLCGFHHVLVHHSDWTIVMAADGIPEFIPPAALDPQQLPRRNTYHRRT